MRSRLFVAAFLLSMLTNHALAMSQGEDCQVKIECSGDASLSVDLGPLLRFEIAPEQSTALRLEIPVRVDSWCGGRYERIARDLELVIPAGTLAPGDYVVQFEQAGVVRQLAAAPVTSFDVCAFLTLVRLGNETEQGRTTHRCGLRQNTGLSFIAEGTCPQGKNEEAQPNPAAQ